MISEEETTLRVFFIGYIKHKHFMYINYMEKAKLWADFLMPIEVVENDSAHFIDHLPAVVAPDICGICRHNFGDTFGGRLREGCYRCKKTYDKNQVSHYEVQELSKILGISYNWCEIFIAQILLHYFPANASLSR